MPIAREDMEVCFVYPHIYGPGGYPRDILRLYQEIKQLGKVRVSAIHDQGLKFPAILSHKFIKQKDNDNILIHFFGVFFPSYFLLAKLLQKNQIPYIVSPLGQILPNALKIKKIKKNVYLNVFGKRFLKNAVCLHAFTNDENNSIRALGINTKAVEHPFGIYAEDLILTNGINKFGDYLFCFGRLDIEHKGIDVLLDGFACYLNEYKGKLNLVIAGRNWNDSHRFIVNRIKQLGLSERVSFLGEIDEATKYSLIESCAAFVYPTRRDGPPRPIRDALALRKRLLITFQANIHNNIESLGWGYQFNPEAGQLAKAIEKLENENTLKEYVDPGKLLSWTRIASQFSETYLGLRENG